MALARCIAHREVGGAANRGWTENRFALSEGLQGEPGDYRESS